MASKAAPADNTYAIPDKYEDLEPAPQLDNKTLNSMALRSLFLQSSFNYATMQSGGWLFGMLPGLKKIHKNKKDLSASMYHNLDFINTHPFLVTFVMGIVLSLEQNKADTQSIRAVRISAASPLGGIGDALFWLTLVPITAGITSNWAIQGSWVGPVVFLLIFNAAQFALRFGLMHWSYKLGTSAIDVLMDHMPAFTRAASIMGVFVVASLTVILGDTQVNLSVPNGEQRAVSTETIVVSDEEAESFTELDGVDVENAPPGTVAMTDQDGNPLVSVDEEGNETPTSVEELGNGFTSVTYGVVEEEPVEFSVAETLDTVLPKLVPLALVMLLYYLFTRRNFTPLKGIGLVLLIGILGAGPFGWWPNIW